MMVASFYEGTKASTLPQDGRYIHVPNFSLWCLLGLHIVDLLLDIMVSEILEMANEELKR
jgi:hypothetical protein